jgi:type IV secretory pathway VirB4 component
MKLVHTTRELRRDWNRGTNLENAILAYDFFRLETGYSPDRPLILTKDGGFFAIFELKGFDPEPLAEETLARIAEGFERAVGTLATDAKGIWELQSIFVRQKGEPPTLETPTRDSEALRYLARSSNEYWRSRKVFEDRLFFCVKYRESAGRSAKEGLASLWKGLSSESASRLELGRLQDVAARMRRDLTVFVENLRSVEIRRPRSNLGVTWANEARAAAVLWELVNDRRLDTQPTGRKDVAKDTEGLFVDAAYPLCTQIAASTRADETAGLTINGRPAKVLTWKIPPQLSCAHLFSQLQAELSFPFSIRQNFVLEPMAAKLPMLKLKANMAAALEGRSAAAAEYRAEAEELITELEHDKKPTFRWYFAIVVSDDTEEGLRDKAIQIASRMRRLKGAEVLEETSNRLLGEIATLPGNARFGLRANIVTSVSVANLACLYKLDRGDKSPFLLFGDRRSGTFGYSLFSRAEVSWNRAVLGLPGSGKSMLLNAFLLGTASFPSQAYVLDRGNSYGPIFEVLSSEMPGDVASMRFGSGNFRCNPFPLVWALKERARQKADGSYRMELPDGGHLECPVESAKTFFESWLDGLIGQGKPLEPAAKNRLDKALKGDKGRGGFFSDFENQCQMFIAHEGSRDAYANIPKPRPLSCLLTHLRSEAPEFKAAVELWTREPRSQYFDSGDDSIASAKYIYFELSGIENDPLLAVPFVMCLVGAVWQRVQNPRFIDEKKIVLIDEAWAFLAQPAFQKVIEDMFRTIRKFGGGVTLATQSPQEIKSGPARQMLQTMSEFFLYRGFQEPEFLEQDLQMDSHHQELHESLREDAEKREVFFASKRGLHRVLTVEIPPALYWFATTDSEDKAERARFCRRFGLAEGIRRLVAACDGRTISSADVRLARVRAYAERHHI